MKAKTNLDIHCYLTFGLFIALFMVRVARLLSTDCLATPFQKYCQDPCQQCLEMAMNNCPGVSRGQPKAHQGFPPKSHTGFFSVVSSSLLTSLRQFSIHSDVNQESVGVKASVRGNHPLSWKHVPAGHELSFILGKGLSQGLNCLPHTQQNASSSLSPGTHTADQGEIWDGRPVKAKWPSLADRGINRKAS